MASFTVRNINPEGGYYIRMLPVYAESQAFKSPVTRCPAHAGLDHVWNKDFSLEYRHHLIRYPVGLSVLLTYKFTEQKP